MKHLITLLLLTFTSICFAQNGGIIVGKVLDKELNNEPLIFAEIAIKGTAIKADSDVTGFFYFENLAEGDYTIVCSFVGYETKEFQVHLDPMQVSEVNFSLAASRISLDDLASLSMSATRNDDGTSSVATNN